MTRKEFNIIDDRLVNDVTLLVRDKVGSAKKKDVEVKYPYPISSQEKNKIRQKLEHGLSERVDFIPSEDSEGATTLIQIKKKRKIKIYGIK